MPDRPLPGLVLLQRSDGRRWSEVLAEPLSDTALAPPGFGASLEHIDQAVTRLLSEVTRTPFPDLVIHIGPDDAGKADATAFASLLVASRAERLVQCVELSASCLANLENGSLQVSAIAARALFETFTVSMDVREQVVEAWRDIRLDRGVIQSAASDFSSPLWSLLWSGRFATRLTPELEHGWPKAVNVVTRLERMAKGSGSVGDDLRSTYAWLCEATHPNVEAQGVFWRIASPDVRGRCRIRFAPTSSQSPVKLAILNALTLAIPFLEYWARVLWWMAADVVSACPPERNAETRALGLPKAGRRLGPCPCGSNVAGGSCWHPEPLLLQ